MAKALSLVHLFQHVISTCALAPLGHGPPSARPRPSACRPFGRMHQRQPAVRGSHAPTAARGLPRPQASTHGGHPRARRPRPRASDACSPCGRTSPAADHWQSVATRPRRQLGGFPTPFSFFSRTDQFMPVPRPHAGKHPPWSKSTVRRTVLAEGQVLQIRWLRSVFSRQRRRAANSRPHTPTACPTTANRRPTGDSRPARATGRDRSRPPPGSQQRRRRQPASSGHQPPTMRPSPEARGHRATGMRLYHRRDPPRPPARARRRAARPETLNPSGKGDGILSNLR